MVEPILISPFFIEYLLPFILVFTLIFAILEKTQLLGEDKRRVNAIIGLVIGLILIASPANAIVVQLMPFLAVAAVILFVFMLLYGFVVGKTEGDVLGKWWKVVFGALLAIALVMVLLIITGWWDFVYDFMFNTSTGTQVWVNGLLVIVIAGAIVAVLFGKKD
ncbi:hypothetical protein GF386_02555 [Candidatus Pacearchaeota archaeon]|nr:hypothetical protein [Candidatus Pacearchaeota archaeon]MBD3283025.1 hypothetical protein [Candidatus Pacearchaeota archaeon]